MLLAYIIKINLKPTYNGGRGRTPTNKEYL